MKKLLSLLLILCLIVSLAACGRNPGNEGPAENEQQAENNRPETTQPDAELDKESKDTPEQSGNEPGTFNTNAPLDETAEEETIHFDLSQYEQHGELSCGRIWCSIVEGDWDTPNEEWFAYFDCWGNQISEWFKGADNNRYNCVIDHNGNFIKDPY